MYIYIYIYDVYIKQSLIHRIPLIMLTFITLQLSSYKYCNEEFNFFHSKINCSITGIYHFLRAINYYYTNKRTEQERFLTHQLSLWRKNWE